MYTFTYYYNFTVNFIIYAFSFHMLQKSVDEFLNNLGF